MDFNEYQAKAETTALYDEKLKALIYEKIEDLDKDYVLYLKQDLVDSIILPLFRISYVAHGLGEVGEVQNKVKKIIRDSGGKITDQTKQDIKGELGDIIWYVAAMCKELGLNMNDVATSNLKKLSSRQKRGVLTGSGDNR